MTKLALAIDVMEEHINEELSDRADEMDKDELESAIGALNSIEQNFKHNERWDDTRLEALSILRKAYAKLQRRAAKGDDASPPRKKRSSKKTTTTKAKDLPESQERPRKSGAQAVRERRAQRKESAGAQPIAGVDAITFDDKDRVKVARR